MYPNPTAGHFPNPAIGGALPTVPIRYPPNMIKAINNNHPITTMASPFFVDNLLQHQKAAVNFQSQFVNSQLHSYIQEQHHQFMMQQSQLRHQQALKYAASNLQQESYATNEELNRKNPLERLSGFSPQHNSRGNSPNSEEAASPRMDYDDDEEHTVDGRKRKRDDKSNVKDDEDPKEKNCVVNIQNINGETKINELRNRNYNEVDNKEENSHSGDEDRFTEESPVGSPLNNGINSTVKNEYQMSPTSYGHQAYYNSFQQERGEKYEEKKDEDSVCNKDEFHDDTETNTNNDSDPEVNRSDRDRLRNPCSNCGSYDCNPFYPSCRNYGVNSIGLRRYETIDRRLNSDNSDAYNRSPIRNEINGGDERILKFGDKDGHLELIKRTNLDSGQGVVSQKPVLKFSVSAILGNDPQNDGERTSAGASIMKIGHHDGFSVSSGGVFALPGFPLAPIAKPIASRPPAFPPHLHSLLAHCRQHPYLTVGGTPSGPVFMPGGAGGAPFPWAGGSRGKPRRGMMRRAVFSDTQRRGLERRFQLQKYISKPDRKKLAEKLGLKDSQVKIWFQNRRMKWRNSKERELLASGGSREQTLPNKNNPHPDLSDAETDRPKLSPLSPSSPEQENPQNDLEKTQKNKFSASGVNPNQFDGQFDSNSKCQIEDGSYRHYEGSLNGVRSYSLMAADDAMVDDYDSENGSGSDEEINVT